MTIRYAKRSVQIEGRLFNPGDIIPEYITDEAAIAAHAFDENTIKIDTKGALNDLGPTSAAEPDEEVVAIDVEGAELINSDEKIEVDEAATVAPKTTKRGSK